MEDRNVILIILGTILIVFLIVFSFTPNNNRYNQEIEWKNEFSPPSQRSNLY